MLGLSILVLLLVEMGFDTMVVMVPKHVDSLWIFVLVGATDRRVLQIAW